MQSNGWPRLLSFVIWTLVGLSAAYWGLRLGEGRASAPLAPAMSARPAGVDAAAVMAALGAGTRQEASPQAGPGRLELLGVVAAGRDGVALMSVDGQPARPVRVGARLDERLLLQSVGRQHAVVADAATGALVQRLDLPAAAPSPLPAGLSLVTGTNDH